MDIMLRILITVLFVHTAQSYDLAPLSKESCPSKDYSTNTCWEMTQRNTSCIVTNVTFGCSQKTQSKSQGSAFQIHSILERMGIRTHSSWPDICYDVFRKNCTVTACNLRCCPGYVMEKDNTCSKQGGSNICENGGTFSNSRGTCICREGFSGDRCEQVTCPETCFNGGTCTRTADGNKCNCPEPFYGPACAESKSRCGEECLNGGTCLESSSSTVCLCTEGFFGKTCAHTIQPHCPLPNDTLCLEPHCRDVCTSAADCQDGLVCCNDGCCNTCTRPVADVTCKFEGQVYRPGQTFYKDQCTVCKCSNLGRIDCVEKECPSTSPCFNGHVTKPEGSCCPVCDNEEKLPEGYTPPRITCPRVGILPVLSFTNTAFVNGMGVRAYDYRNRALVVNYHPSVLKHCACPLGNRDNHLVMATTMDRYHRTANCSFNVFVVDNDPPKFSSCPADIYAMEDEKVTWDRPRVTDNVGVRSLVMEPHGWDRDRQFGVGNHTLTYRATDYDGNMEFCQFTVFIFDKDTLPSQMPPGLARRHSDFSKGIQVIAGCLTFVFVIITGVLIGCFIRRWRLHKASQNQRRRDQQRVPAVSNGIYDSFRNYFSGVKLPPYTPPSAPPVYEEHAVNAGPSESDLPPQYEELDGQRSRDYDNAVYDNAPEQENHVGDSEGGQHGQTGDPMDKGDDVHGTRHRETNV